MSDGSAGESAKIALDGMAGLVVLGTLTSFLPPFAAFLAIIYTMIRIWETETVKGMTGRLPPRDRYRDSDIDSDEE